MEELGRSESGPCARTPARCREAESSPTGGPTAPTSAIHCPGRSNRTTGRPSPNHSERPGRARPSGAARSVRWIHEREVRVPMRGEPVVNLNVDLFGLGHRLERTGSVTPLQEIVFRGRRVDDRECWEHQDDELRRPRGGVHLGRDRSHGRRAAKRSSPTSCATVRAVASTPAATCSIPTRRARRCQVGGGHRHRPRHRAVRTPLNSPRVNDVVRRSSLPRPGRRASSTWIRCSSPRS